MKEISVQELKARMDAGTSPRVVDVREEFELENGTITEVHIPLGQIAVRTDEFGAKDEEIVVTCRSGGRSGQAVMYLQSQGYTNVINLTGGMLAWAREIDPSFNEY
ncbi:MAG: rhodanese-like domain-containing protein [Bacteroidota bacterium]